MKMVKSLLVGIGFAAFAASLVMAADAPPRQQNVPKGQAYVPYNWTGAYIGLNGGAGVGTSGANSSPFSVIVANDPADRMRGWLLGGQVGVRKQVGSVVFGVRADIDWADIENRSTSSNTVRRTFFATQLADTTSSQTNGAKVNWLSTVTGQVGVTLWERVLWSVQGGLAVGEVKWDNSQNVTTQTLSPTGVAFCNNGAISCPSGAAAASDSKTKYGWTAGSIVEVALDNRWSLMTEVDYVNLGSVGGATGSQRVDLWIAKGGVNLRF